MSITNVSLKPFDGQKVLNSVLLSKFFFGKRSIIFYTNHALFRQNKNKFATVL